MTIWCAFAFTWWRWCDDILTLDLECDDSDELIGEPTSNFRCGGVEENFVLSTSITLPVADDDALLRLDVFPLLKKKKKHIGFEQLNIIADDNLFDWITIYRSTLTFDNHDHCRNMLILHLVFPLLLVLKNPLSLRPNIRPVYLTATHLLMIEFFYTLNRIHLGMVIVDVALLSCSISLFVFCHVYYCYDSYPLLNISSNKCNVISQNGGGVYFS